MGGTHEHAVIIVSYWGGWFIIVIWAFTTDNDDSFCPF